MTGNQMIESEIYSVPIMLRALKEAVISPAHGYQTYALFLNFLTNSIKVLERNNFVHDVLRIIGHITIFIR